MYYNLRCATAFKICILAEIARCKPQFVVLFLLLVLFFVFSDDALCGGGCTCIGNADR